MRRLSGMILLYFFQQPFLVFTVVGQFIYFFCILDDAAAKEAKHRRSAKIAFFRLKDVFYFDDNRPAFFLHAEPDRRDGSIARSP